MKLEPELTLFSMFCLPIYNYRLPNYLNVSSIVITSTKFPDILSMHTFDAYFVIDRNSLYLLTTMSPIDQHYTSEREAVNSVTECYNRACKCRQYADIWKL